MCDTYCSARGRDRVRQERKRQKEMTMCRVKQLYNHRKPYINIIFAFSCITGVQNAKLINKHENNVSDLSDLISHTNALGRKLFPLENKKNAKRRKSLSKQD